MPSSNNNNNGLGDKNSNNNSNKFLFVFLVTATASTVVGYGCCWFSKWVQDYGMEGALNYIWEGDPYPAFIRPFLDQLDSVSDQLREQRWMISALQRTLEQAQSETSKKSVLNSWKYYFERELSAYSNNNSPSSSSSSSSFPNTIKPPVDLKVLLGSISNQLDKLAARIDAILPPSTKEVTSAASQKHVLFVRQGKKNLSQQIVQLMEEMDALMTFYKTHQEQEQKQQ